MISVICVYNDKTVLEDFLIRSLREQDAPCDTVLVDNTARQFASASQALNHGAKQARGDYLMFVHQDVALSSPSWLRDAEGILKAIPNLGVAGVAGTRKDASGRPRTITRITHGTPPRLVAFRELQQPEEVQTVDECAIIIPREVFGSLHFDEELRDGYHLYAVDYSLSVARMGLRAWAVPLPAYHRSDGSARRGLARTILSLGPYPDAYYQTLGRLLRKHRKDVGWIYATTGRWNTSHPLVLQRVPALSRYLAYTLAVRLLGPTRVLKLASALDGHRTGG